MCCVRASLTSTPFALLTFAGQPCFEWGGEDADFTWREIIEEALASADEVQATISKHDVSSFTTALDKLQSALEAVRGSDAWQQVGCIAGRLARLFKHCTSRRVDGPESANNILVWFSSPSTRSLLNRLREEQHIMLEFTEITIVFLTVGAFSVSSLFLSFSVSLSFLGREGDDNVSSAVQRLFWCCLHVVFSSLLSVAFDLPIATAAMLQCCRKGGAR